MKIKKPLIDFPDTVYFLGAGASANSIPVLEKMKERLFQFSKHISSSILGINSQTGGVPVSFNSDEKDILNIIEKDLTWLIEELKYHSSVDTLAKKYFLKYENGGEFLIRLKKTLCIYFLFEQWFQIPGQGALQYQAVDQRYDGLISSLLEKQNNDIVFKQGIKFISWNYDLQFEKALLPYTDLNLINDLKEKYFIIPNRKTFDDNDSVFHYNNNVSFIKLNGNAFLDKGLEDGTNSETIYDRQYLYQNEYEGLKYFLEEYKKIFPENSNTSNSLKYFNYAWERKSENLAYKTINETIALAKHSFDNAKKLIIIGYSFPFVNFEIDKEILSDCNPEEIIIQDKYPEIIEQRLRNLIDFNYSPKPNLISSIIKTTHLKPSNNFPTP